MSCASLISTVCWKPFKSCSANCKRGFRQQHADELLAHIESQASFGIGDLGACDGRLIASGLQAPLPLVTTFEQVPDPNIELLSLVQIVAGKILRTEEWDELRVRA